MPIHTPIYTFGSIAEANGSVIKSGILWRVYGADGVVIAGGVGDGTAIYPAQRGCAIATANIDASATTGYEVLSGTVTAVLTAGGAGYTDTDVLTVVGGTIVFGATTIGTAMTFVATVVAGEVTAITPSAGTAGSGDYLIIPDTTAAVATTYGGAGTGCTVTLTQGVTGFSLDGANAWVLNPKRTAGTPSAVNVRLPVLNQGAAGWWFPSVVGINVTCDALDQVSVDAVNFEDATSLRVRTERLGTLDGSEWGDALIAADNATAWTAGLQRTNLGQAASTATHVVAAADELAIESQLSLRDDVTSVPMGLVSVQDLKSASKMEPVIGSQAVLFMSGITWTFAGAATETNDRAFISIIAYAGPTANDEQTWTIDSIYGRDMGWAAR